jgi:drug/metabolite transporter (DMT)-like permease
MTLIPVRFQGPAGAAAIVAMWTGFILIGRFGVTRNLTAPDLIALRYAAAAPVLLLLWFRGGRPDLLRRPLLLLAAPGGIFYAGFTYAGFALAPAAHAGLLLPGLLPVSTAVLAWILLGQRPGAGQWLAQAGVLLGLVLFFTAACGQTNPSWAGDLLLAAGSFCWALYGVLMRRWGVSPVETATAVAVFTAAVYLPVYWLWLPKNLAAAPPGEIVLQVVYQGLIASVVQMLLYVHTVRLIGPARLTLAMALIAPLVALAAVPLLDEPLGPGLVAAIAVTTFSVWWGGHRRGSAAAFPVHALR